MEPFRGTSEGPAAQRDVLARMYLGVDHPTDWLFGALFGMGITFVMFRLITPETVFPVTYAKGKASHLDTSGARGEAIRRAVQEQLGFEVLSIEPFGWAGSGGSTPLRLKVAGAADTELFGKLYAATHLRSDRNYKLTRAILYGALEDEKSFRSVRQLVQYEDYLAMAGATAERVRAEVRHDRIRGIPGLEDTLVALHLAILAARPWQAG